MPSKAPEAYLYHLTPQSWHKRITLRPRQLFCGSDVEPKFARICTCPSPAQCMIAIDFLDGISYYLYRTLRKVSGRYAWNVADAAVTSERWLLKPTTFVRVATIKEGAIPRYENHWDSWDNRSTGGLLYYYEALYQAKWKSDLEMRRALKVLKVRRRNLRRMGYLTTTS